VRYGTRYKKIDHVIAQPEIAVEVVHAGAHALPRQRIEHRFSNSARHVARLRLVAIAHEQDAICQQNRFIHIVGDQEYGLLRLAHDGYKFLLYGAARRRIQSTKGLVE
jgi:hypothetical protein